MAERLSIISGGVARTLSQLEELEAAREASQKVEAELADARKEIASLKDVVRRQQDRLRQQEESLRVSLRPGDLVPLLERKYWDGIRMCRRVLRLIRPGFPSAVLHPLNASALRADDLLGIAGRPFPSGAHLGPSEDPLSPGPSEPSDLEASLDLPELAELSGSQPPVS